MTAYVRTAADKLQGGGVFQPDVFQLDVFQRGSTSGGITEGTARTVASSRAAADSINWMPESVAGVGPYVGDYVRTAEDEIAVISEQAVMGGLILMINYDLSYPGEATRQSFTTQGFERYIVDGSLEVVMGGESVPGRALRFEVYNYDANTDLDAALIHDAAVQLVFDGVTLFGGLIKQLTKTRKSGDDAAHVRVACQDLTPKTAFRGAQGWTPPTASDRDRICDIVTGAVTGVDWGGSTSTVYIEEGKANMVWPGTGSYPPGSVKDWLDAICAETGYIYWADEQFILHYCRPAGWRVWVLDPAAVPVLDQTWDTVSVAATDWTWGMDYDAAGGAGGATKVFWAVKNTAYIGEYLCSDRSLNRSVLVDAADDSVSGVCRHGSYVYAVYFDTSALAWKVRRFTASSLTLDTTYSSVSFPNSTPSNPVIASDGSYLYIADRASADTHVVWNKYDSSMVKQGSTIDTGVVMGPLYDIYTGSADYGAWRLVAVGPDHLDCYAFDSSGSRQTNDEFPLTSASAEHSGIAYGDALGDGVRFWTSQDSPTVLAKHSNWVWTTESAVYWVAYSWYDSVVTTHETQCGPRASVTMGKRKQLTVTCPPIGGGDVDNHRVYMERGASDPGLTNLKLQATFATDGTTLTTFATGGAADPGSNDFGTGTEGISAAPFAIDVDTPNYTTTWPVLSISHELDSTEWVNSVFAQGPGASDVAYSTWEPYTDWGITYRVVSDEAIVDATTAHAYAEAYIEAHRTRESVVFKVAKAGLLPGQDVYIYDDALGLDGQYHIRQVTFRQPAGLGTEEWEVEAGTHPGPDLPRVVAEIEEAVADVDGRVTEAEGRLGDVEDVAEAAQTSAGDKLRFVPFAQETIASSVNGQTSIQTVSCTSAPSDGTCKAVAGWMVIRRTADTDSESMSVLHYTSEGVAGRAYTTGVQNRGGGGSFAYVETGGTDNRQFKWLSTDAGSDNAIWIYAVGYWTTADA